MIDSTILANFKCIQCGECCRWTGSVLLTDRDITRIANRLNLSEQAFIDKQTRLSPNRIQLALIDTPDGSCRFLVNNGCSIYPDRPEQCRTFPFSWQVKEGCPALDALRAKQKRGDS